jgi:hypothetical protein
MKFADVVARLDRVLNLARGLGLADEVAASRFLQYRDRIAAMIATGTVVDGKLDGMAQVEAIELVAIAGYLEASDAETVAPKLRRALRGPFLPDEEDDGSNEGRNFLFELAVAERLSRGGLLPQLGEHPEIRFDVGRVPLFVQCKRVFSERRVSRCIARAEDQLREDLGPAPIEARGLIAVSLSRLLKPAPEDLAPGQSPGDVVRRVSCDAEATAFVDGALLALWGKAEAFRRRRPPRIIGILFHAAAPVIHEHSGLVVRVEHMILNSVAETVEDQQALRDLNTHLQTTMG